MISSTHNDPESPTYQPRRFTDTSEGLTRLARLKRVYHRYFVIGGDSYIDVVFGVLFAFRLYTEPVWVYLIGPPSRGKNELLEAIASDTKQVFVIDRITARTLVSGMKRKTGKDPSLLPHILGKTLLIKDFTTLLSGRRETLTEICGQLRSIYDGRYDSGYGTGARKSYTGKLGLIAGVTDAIDKHQHILTPLGERFLYYRMPQVTEAEEFERCQRTQMNMDVAAQKAALARAAFHVLANPVAEPPAVSSTFTAEITRLGLFIAKARHTSAEDPYTHEPDIADREIATRVTKQIRSLACGIAMAREHSFVTRDDMDLLRHVAFHCMPVRRKKILDFVVANWPDYVETIDIANHLRCNPGVVVRWLWELYRVRLIKQRKEDRPDARYASYSWRLAKDILLSLRVKS